MKEKLINLLNNSYSPYSNFRVSAILVMDDLKEFNGVNVENASYGASICAERTAITQAIANGYKKENFKELHVLCGDSKTISTPCFICRQTISELFNKDASIYCYNKNGEFREFKVSELCPYPFDSEDLK